MIKVVIYKMTKLACAPDEIYNTLRRKSFENFDFIFIFKNERKLKDIVETLDDEDSLIIHFNNKMIDLSMYHKPNVFFLLQYHSEPERVDLNLPKNYRTAVLNQYHCLLDEYKNCDFIVRNNFKHSLPFTFHDTIKIGYYPSTIKKYNQYYDKGYNETVIILDEIRHKYTNVQIEVKTKMTYENCIDTKKDCHIIIDECVTGSFHKTTIEGIMMGSVVVVHIRPELVQKHIELYGKILPVENTPINHLQQTLCDLIDLGRDKLEQKALENYEYFTEYWNDDIIANEFKNIYETVIEK